MKRDLPNATRYEDYNVMDQQEHWDDHTRSIVERRLELESRLQVFHPEKAACMQAICACIVDDYRPEIIGFIVQHIDQTLHQTIGESDRKVNVPEAKPLILAGLTAVEQTAILKRGKAFPSLAKTEQSSMLKEIEEGRAEPAVIWEGVPQKPLFAKWLTMTLEAYYSHPAVWSEIGYGGPAYPRGYVRTQLGQLDPWEAHTKQPEGGKGNAST